MPGEGLDADHVDRSHGGNVERRRQRDAHRDQPAKLAVVVERPVKPALLGQFERRIFEQRSRREQAALERERVEKRLQRRAWLAHRAHAVDIGRAGKLAGAADVGPDLAGGIFDHQHRAIVDVAIVDLGHVAAQRVERESLQVAIERGLRGETAVAQQLLGDARRQRDAGEVARAGRERPVNGTGRLAHWILARSTLAHSTLRARPAHQARAVGCPSRYAAPRPGARARPRAHWAP